jgi:hypothetical protein
MAQASKVKKLVVTSPLVQVVDEGNRIVQLYRGASLDGIKESEVGRLIDLGMVGEDDSVVPGIAFDFTPTA